MLFDCGEGTLQQLNRKFGYEKTLEILKNLKAIYISHLHADHQMGFIGIVQQREAGLLTDDFNQIWSLTQLYSVDYSQSRQSKKVCFQQTHNQGLCQLFSTVSWDLHA